MLNTLIVIRNVLLKTFVISLAYVFIVLIFYLGMHNFIISMVSTIYKVPPILVNLIVVHFIVMIKFFMLFVLLFPALAVHWTIKKMQHKEISG